MSCGVSIIGGFFIGFTRGIFYHQLGRQACTGRDTHIFVNLGGRLFCHFTPRHDCFFHNVEGRRQYTSFAPMERKQRVQHINFGRGPILQRGDHSLYQLCHVFGYSHSTRTCVRARLCGLLYHLRTPQGTIRSSTQAILFGRVRHILVHFTIIGCGKRQRLVYGRGLFFRCLRLFFTTISFMIVVRPSFASYRRLFLHNGLFCVTTPINNRQVRVRHIRASNNVSGQVFFHGDCQLLTHCCIHATNSSTQCAIFKGQERRLVTITIGLLILVIHIHVGCVFVRCLVFRPFNVLLSAGAALASSSRRSTTDVVPFSSAPRDATNFGFTAAAAFLPAESSNTCRFTVPLTAILSLPIPSSDIDFGDFFTFKAFSRSLASTAQDSAFTGSSVPVSTAPSDRFVVFFSTFYYSFYLTIDSSVDFSPSVQLGDNIKIPAFSPSFGIPGTLELSCRHSFIPVYSGVFSTMSNVGKIGDATEGHVPSDGLWDAIPDLPFLLSSFTDTRNMISSVCLLEQHTEIEVFSMTSLVLCSSGRLSASTAIFGTDSSVSSSDNSLSTKTTVAPSGCLFYVTAILLAELPVILTESRLCLSVDSSCIVRPSYTYNVSREE